MSYLILLSLFSTENNVRPRPNVSLKKGGKFLMCNGYQCRRKRCTYAHSELELKTWNDQLSKGKYILVDKEYIHVIQSKYSLVFCGH